MPLGPVARVLGRAARRAAPTVARAVGKSPGAGTRAAVPVELALRRSGVPAAQNLGTLMVGARNAAEREGGKVFSVLRPAINALSRQERRELAQGFQGQAVTNPKVQEIINASQRYFDQIGSNPQQLLETMIQRGLQPSRRFLADGRRVAATLFDEAAQERAGLFLKNQSKPLLDAIRESGDRQLLDFAQRGIRQFGGLATDPGTLNEVLAGARALNVATQLGQAVILNTTQPALSTITAGVIPTLRGIGRLLRSPREAADFALRTGSAFDAAVSEFMRGEALGGRSAITRGVSRLATGVLRRTGFLAVERFNRILAANIGREFAPLMARRAVGGNPRAVRQLGRFGLNPKRIIERGGRLTEEELAIASQNFVRKTQFRLTPEELPLLASDPTWGPAWRTLAQFKTFSLKATQLLLEEGQINPGGLVARGIPLSFAAGEAAQTTRKLVRGEDPEAVLTRGLDSPGGIFLRSLENVTAVGLAGLFWDFLRATTFPGGALEFAAGPTLSGGAEFIEGTQQALTGRPRTLRRATLRRIPIAGPTIERLTR